MLNKIAMWAFRMPIRLKQSHPRRWLGGLLQIYSSVGIIVTPLTYLGIFTTVWNTGGRVFIQQWLPWFSFPIFIGAMVAFGVIAMGVYYKYIYPSLISFSSQQVWQHDNPVKLYLEEMKKEILDEVRNNKSAEIATPDNHSDIS